MADSDLPPGCIRHGVPFGQLCYRCNSAGTIPSAFGPFSPILPVPVDVPTGWECPRCKHVYGPLTRECWRCSPPSPIVTAEDLPRPRADDSPAFRLPGHMAQEGGQQIVRLGAGWNEVFPGLQCAIFLPTDDDGNVVAHFRLTPEDGQDG